MIRATLRRLAYRPRHARVVPVGEQLAAHAPAARRGLGVLAVVVAVLVASTAVAFFTPNGAGVGAGVVGNLGTPSGVVGLSSGSSVSVTWTGVPRLTVASFGYYVTRTPSPSGTAAFACGSSPTSLLAATAVSCTDTSVPDGTYTYTVTAVANSFSATSTPSGSVVVFTAPVDHFDLTPSTSTPTAGTGFTVALAARSASNTLLTGYTGSKCITFTGPANALSGATPTYPGASSCSTGSRITFSNGLATGISITLVRAELVQLVATETTGTQRGTANLTVGAGASAKLSFTQQPANSSTGVAFPTQPVVTARDAFDNTATSFAATVTLAIRSGTPTTGGPGTLSGCAQTRVSGVVTFTGCTITTGGVGYVLRATSGTLTAGDSAAFNISGAVAALRVTPSTTTPTAGTPFTLTLTAVDSAGLTVPTYTGTKTVAWSGAATSPGGTAPSYPVTSIAFTSGVSTTTLTATLHSAGANTVTATASTPTLVGSTSVTVTAAGGTRRLAWSLVSMSRGSLSGSCFFTCTYTGIGRRGGTFQARLRLTDTYGNAVTNTGSAISVIVTNVGGSFSGSNVVSIGTGASVSNTGGDSSASGKITFLTSTGAGWTPNSLTAAAATLTSATAAFSR